MAGRNAEAARERATESLRRSKAAGNCNFFDCQCSRFNLTPCSFEAKILDVPCRCLAYLLLKQASEVPRTHGRAPGKTFDGKVAPNVVRKPGK